MAVKREYRMSARADAVADTVRRIVAAVVALHTEKYSDEISLDDVAARAGVTVPTVLRHFGSRERLMWAVTDQTEAEVRQQRWDSPVGDVEAAIDNLVDHYEERGPMVLRLLAQEDRAPQLVPLLDVGRRVHSDWVARTFAPFLDGDDGSLETRIAVVTDVYVWKLLRIDRGLDRAATAAHLRSLVQATLGGRTS